MVCTIVTIIVNFMPCLLLILINFLVILIVVH